MANSGSWGIQVVNKYRAEFQNRLLDLKISIQNNADDIGTLRAVVDHCVRVLDDIWEMGYSPAQTAEEYAAAYLKDVKPRAKKS